MSYVVVFIMSNDLWRQIIVRFLDNGEIVDYISLFKLSFDNVKEISLLHAE
jgi:hypothetical protein